MHIKLTYLAPESTRPWLALKYADALSQSGAEVRVFFTSKNIQNMHRGIVKTNVPFQIFPNHWYLPFVWRMSALNHFRIQLPSFSLLRALVTQDTNIVVASEPGHLGIAAFSAKVHRARLAYIPFEYYPDLSYGDELSKKQYARIESVFAPMISSWISGGDKLTDLYRMEYALGNKVWTVYNGTPRHSDCTTKGLRERIGAGEDKIILFYSGQMTMSRGVWDVLHALTQLPENVWFVAIGYEGIRQLKSDAYRMGLSDRVHTIDAVPQDELMGYTAEADIGVIPIHKVSLSYQLCNPGKLFEYIGAGLPLIVSNLDQLEWYVRSRKLGEVFEAGSPSSLASAVQRLIREPRYLHKCVENVRHTHETEACWEIQAEKLRSAVLP